MGFWSRLFGRKKDAASPVEVPAVVTPVEPVEVTPTIAEVEAQVEALLREMFPGAIEEAEKSVAVDPLEEKKRKRSEAAKKAAATRAANKAKKK